MSEDIDDVLQRVYKERDTLKRQRDKLLEAAKAALNAIDPQLPKRRGRPPKNAYQPPLETYYVEPVKLLRAAIRECGEGT